MSVFFVFAYFSLILSYLDIKYGEIPRIFSVFVLFCVFFTQLSVSYHALIPSLTGALFATFIFGSVYFITKKNLGIADIWYAIGAGFVLGIKYFIISVIFACITGVILFIIMHFAQKKGKKEKSIPFIPFLSIGYFFSLFCYYFENPV